MKNKLVILALGLLISFGINAQVDQDDYFFRNFGVSAGFNVSYAPGLRLEIGTGLSERIKCRVGIGLLPWISSFNNEIPIVVEDANKKIKDHIRDNNVNPKIVNDYTFNSYHAQLLFDIFPKENGIFHFTAGVLVGRGTMLIDASLINKTNNKHYVDELRADGTLSKDEEFPIVSSGGIRFKGNHNGSAKIKAHFGNILKPYVGIGIGRTIPNHRIGFKLEVGTFYSGQILVSSDNLIDINNEAYNKKKVSTIINEEIKGAKDPTVDKTLRTSRILSGFSPSVNLQLIIRLF